MSEVWTIDKASPLGGGGGSVVVTAAAVAFVTAAVAAIVVVAVVVGGGGGVGAAVIEKHCRMLRSTVPVRQNQSMLGLGFVSCVV